MIELSDYLEVGRLSKTHGTQGEIACTLTRDFPEDKEPEYVLLLIDNISVPFYIDDWRYKGGEVVLLSLDGVNTEKAAKRLLGCKLYLAKTLYGTEEADSLTWQELKGFTIVDKKRGEAGVISEVDESTINTLFLLDTGAVLPAHENLIARIDTENHKIIMDLPEGLI